MNSQNQNQNQNETDIKVIENWQTYIKKSKLKPQTVTLKHTLRPFRRGEKRMETMTNRWINNVTDTEHLRPDYQLNFIQTIQEQSENCIDFFKKQIKRKLNSYYNQDLKKGIFNTENAITMDQTMQLLLDSNLNCYYCQQQVKILYETVRDPLQWTLERLNNEFGHNNGNLVVSCLQCNLRRRTMNSEKYVKTKQMIYLEKIDESLDEAI